MKSTKIVSKHLRLPNTIVTTLEDEAFEYGYKFNDWVKIILTNRVVELKEKEEHVDLTRDDILQAIKESRSGKYPVLKTKEDVRKFFDAIYNE